MGAKKKSTTSNIESAVTAARAAIKSARAALSAVDLASLTADERLHSNGRLRDGEEDAVLALLDAMDARPSTFEALADRDGGSDPKAVETAPVRNALARRQVLVPLAAELESLLTAVSDDVLASGATAKAMSVPAYAIAKASASVDAKLRKMVSPALDFYAKTSRKKKKTAKE